MRKRREVSKMAEEKRIGVVTHYFGKITVAIIELKKEGLSVGDTVHIKGHTSDFTQKVESMELEHKVVHSKSHIEEGIISVIA